MRHAILTCKNHPDLRWSCKSIAIDENAQPGEPARYDGSRAIFFNGTPTGKGMYPDGSGLDCSTALYENNDWKTGKVLSFVHECDCPSTCLVIAEEDMLVRAAEPPPAAPRPPPVLPTDPALLEELKPLLLRSESRIDAIKLLRARTGIGLKEAYEQVCAMAPEVAK